MVMNQTNYGATEQTHVAVQTVIKHSSVKNSIPET